MKKQWIGGVLIAALMGCGPFLGEEMAFNRYGDVVPTQRKMPHVAPSPNQVAALQPGYAATHPLHVAIYDRMHFVRSAHPRSAATPDSLTSMHHPKPVPQPELVHTAPRRLRDVLRQWIQGTDSRSKSTATLRYNRDKVPFLQLQRPGVQTWPQLAKAIDQTGLRRIGKNRLRRAYYVIDPKATRGTVSHKTPVYQVHLAAKQSVSKIWMSQDDRDETRLATPQAKAWLQQIRMHLQVAS